MEKDETSELTYIYRTQPPQVPWSVQQIDQNHPGANLDLEESRCDAHMEGTTVTPLIGTGTLLLDHMQLQPCSVS